MAIVTVTPGPIVLDDRDSPTGLYRRLSFTDAQTGDIARIILDEPAFRALVAYLARTEGPAPN